MSEPVLSTAAEHDVLVVYCTAPTEEVAKRIAESVVEERLAACVTALRGVRSTYRWKGQVESAQEVLLLLKTTRESFDQLQARIAALHPYEVPEVIATRVEAGSHAYLTWVAQEVG